jgi:hypothetical protein
MAKSISHTKQIKIGTNFIHSGVVFTVVSFPNKNSVYGVNSDIRVKTPKCCTVSINKIQPL